MLSHFTYLKDAGFDFPAPVQAMIILHKLPPTMEVVAQILSQTAPSEIRNLKLDGIVKAATLSFEQKGASHGGSGKAPQANKLSTVKHKQADPKFAQQQQQGGPNGSGSRNAPAQGQGGYCHQGGKKARALGKGPRMPSSPPTSTMRMAQSPPLTLTPWPTPLVPPVMVLLPLITPSRPLTWHTI